MGKNPAFLFYPADWRKDIELQSCSIAARGLWIELICIMHQASPYGFLVTNGTPIDDRSASFLTAIGLKKYRTLKAELVLKGVAKIDDKGTLYSKRMVEDERLRRIRREAGSKGGNPNLVNQKDNQKTEQNPTPSVAVAVTGSVTEKDRDKDKDLKAVGGNSSDISRFLEIPLSGGLRHPVTEIDVQEYQASFPSLDIKQTLRNIRQWAIDNPTKRWTQRGARRGISSWLIGDVKTINNGGRSKYGADRGNGKGGHSADGPGTGEYNQAWGESEYGIKPGQA